MNIQHIMKEGRKNIASNINTIMVQTYWKIGKNIVEFEQKGKEKAEYGSRLLDKLALDLRKKLGKGFNRSNIAYMRLLFLKYPIIQTVSGQLQKTDDQKTKFAKKAE
jgi:hypothetical protein